MRLGLTSDSTQSINIDAMDNIARAWCLEVKDGVIALFLVVNTARYYLNSDV